MTIIKCNEFVKRQTAESPYSHFEGSWEQLEELAMQNFQFARPGYKTGVLLVTVPSKGFFSAITKVTPETELVAKFSPRREGEQAFINVLAKGNKYPAKYCELALYSREVLQENHEETTDAPYEIVNIGASPTEGPTPMDPVTMMRNWLGLPGGTKMEFTKEMAETMTREQWLEKVVNDFAYSTLFASQHVLTIK